MDQCSHLVPESPRSIAVRVMEWMMWSAVLLLWFSRFTTLLRSRWNEKWHLLLKKYWDVRRAIWRGTHDGMRPTIVQSAVVVQQLMWINRSDVLIGMRQRKIQSFVNYKQLRKKEIGLEALGGWCLDCHSYYFVLECLPSGSAAIVENDRAARTCCDISFWLWIAIELFNIDNSITIWQSWSTVAHTMTETDYFEFYIVANCLTCMT
jgi:hypothetical protein